MNSDTLTSPHVLRATFAARLNQLYCSEIATYRQLYDLVEAHNQHHLDVVGDPRAQDPLVLQQISGPRHGAIRVGSPSELRWISRLFAVMDMQPVGFYDLGPAGLPVFSTAFRATLSSDVEICPFRVFCSLLRTDLIPDNVLRGEVKQAIETRRIFSPELIALIQFVEQNGGLSQDQVEPFIAAAVDVFRWSGKARVSREMFGKMAAVHRLIVDVAAFSGPHINHLTPNTLDIDSLHRELSGLGVGAKAIIEGPPARRCSILLRQTAFHAIAEPVAFDGDTEFEPTLHTARFGEVEQRGAALTQKGRALYDDCLAASRGFAESGSGTYGVALEKAFSSFPDDWLTLVEKAFVYYRPVLARGVGLSRLVGIDFADVTSVVSAARKGWLLIEPIQYEDFLPVSAAGIFRSNLGGDTYEERINVATQEQFEQALGRPVVDPYALYQQEQDLAIARLFPTRSLGDGVVSIGP